jgi:hypothetical protein
VPGTVTDVESTVNDPVRVPAAAVHDTDPVSIGGGAVGLGIEQAVSPKLKPVPTKDIEAPRGPDVGDRVTTCGITPSVVDAVEDTMVPVTVIV